MLWPKIIFQRKIKNVLRFLLLVIIVFCFILLFFFGCYYCCWIVVIFLLGVAMKILIFDLTPSHSLINILSKRQKKYAYSGLNWTKKKSERCSVNWKLMIKQRSKDFLVSILNMPNWMGSQKKGRGRWQMILCCW